MREVMTVVLVTDTPTLTASELIAISGVTYRQVDFWCRAGYLKPSTKARPGTGHYRKFAPSEALIAKYALKLIAAGFTAPYALRYARTLVETRAPIMLANGLVEIGRPGWAP
jgi:hypothetical protein